MKSRREICNGGFFRLEQPDGLTLSCPVGREQKTAGKLYSGPAEGRMAVSVLYESMQRREKLAKLGTCKTYICTFYAVTVCAQDQTLKAYLSRPKHGSTQR